MCLISSNFRWIHFYLVFLYVCDYMYLPIGCSQLMWYPFLILANVTHSRFSAYLIALEVKSIYSAMSLIEIDGCSAIIVTRSSLEISRDLSESGSSSMLICISRSKPLIPILNSFFCLT